MSLKSSGGPVTVRSATVRFGETTAIDNVSFTVEAGRSVALIGPNGSGKTTLLRLLAGLARPTNGEVTVPDSITTAYVTQHAGAPSWLPITAGEVVRMGRFRARGALGRFTDNDDNIVAEAATTMGVSDLLHRTYGDLSGGQRQRVRLAQALAQEPDLLLLDEPITGLDLASQQLILDLIDDRTEAGTTVFITTHNLDEARHCDAVILLQGRVVGFGPPADVLTADQLRLAFGDRLLGDHRDHDHAHDLIVFDDHGHH